MAPQGVGIRPPLSLSSRVMFLQSLASSSAPPLARAAWARWRGQGSARLEGPRRFPQTRQKGRHVSYHAITGEVLRALLLFAQIVGISRELGTMLVRPIDDVHPDKGTSHASNGIIAPAPRVRVASPPQNRQGNSGRPRAAWAWPRWLTGQTPGACCGAQRQLAALVSHATPLGDLPRGHPPTARHHASRRGARDSDPGSLPRC